MYQRFGRVDVVAAAMSLISKTLNPQLPIPSTNVTATRMIWSATRKNTEAIATMTKTMAVVTIVSLRDGHVTLRVSSRTSWRNLNGDVAILDAVLSQPVVNRCFLKSIPAGRARGAQAIRAGRLSPYPRLAGAEGLEPPTFGFGDLRSTN